MRVLTIYFRPQRGGLTKRLRRMVAALLDAGNEVETLSAVPLDLREHAGLDARLLGGRAASTTSGLAFWVRFTLGAPIAIARALRARSADAVVVFDPYYAWLAAPACRRHGTPLVLFVRALPWLARPLHGLPPGLRPLADATDRLGIALADRVVVMTEAMGRELIAKVPSVKTRSSVLPNSLDRVEERDREGLRRVVLESQGWPNDSCLLVSSGVLTARKNLPVLVEAIARVSDARVRLLIVGEGEAREEIQQRVDALGVGDRVALTGWRDHPGEVVGGCDLFVLPSTHEGMSNSLLEALGLGLPVLVADTPESRETMPPELLRFAPDDTPGLSRRIEAFAQDPEMQRRIREASAEAATKHDFDWNARVLDEIESAIEGFVHRPGAH